MQGKPCPSKAHPYRNRGGDIFSSSQVPCGKHLDAYLDEFEFRFNNRDNPYLFRNTLLKLIESENLPYRALVSRAG